MAYCASNCHALNSFGRYGRFDLCERFDELLLLVPQWFLAVLPLILPCTVISL